MQNVIVHTLCGIQSFANTQCIRLWQPRFIGLHRTLAALIVLHCIIACLYLLTILVKHPGPESWCWFVLSFIASKCWILSILVLEIRCIKWLNGINFCFIFTAWERILNCWIALKWKTKKSLYRIRILLFSYLMTIRCVLNAIIRAWRLTINSNALFYCLCEDKWWHLLTARLEAVILFQRSNKALKNISWPHLAQF